MKQTTLVLGSAERGISQLDLASVDQVLEFFLSDTITYLEQQINPEVSTYRWSVGDPTAFELLLVASLVIDATYIEIRGRLDENVDSVADELAQLLGAVTCEKLIHDANHRWQEKPSVLSHVALGCPYDVEKYDDKIQKALLATEDDVFRMGVFAATLLPRNMAERLLNSALKCDLEEKRKAYLQRILAENGWGLPQT
ncbi:MAG: hypothetical protein IPJ27_16040 [Candidatus Accumulibacter sp.]|uniref:Uncharacterized protein n=1 Tax=Candidatus Accumulibacter proximus TaxID=2954385 RepID=A0A935UGJ2_9PROT|nr:hypothetical protein [Candidatus Accumulibacter proximus]